MSTWISKSAFLIVSFCLMAACDGPGAGNSAPRNVTVTTDQVVITGPRGFCVDPSSSQQNNSDGAFVALGSCAALNQGPSAEPAFPAILTATISRPMGSGQVASNIGQFDSFFRSEDGRRLLSRTQDPESVTIIETISSPGIFYLHASDRSQTVIGGVQSEYWRAYLDLGSRIITLSVLEADGQSLGPNQSFELLTRFVQSILRAN
jgi:hypothetical protein